MKLATLNLWFEPHEQAKRLAAVINLVKRENFDLVAFQEVVPEVQQVLQRALGGSYHLSDAPPQAYFTSLLVRKTHAVAMNRRPFAESKMGRDVLYARFASLGLVVGTTHLESENSPGVRLKQLEECTRVLGAVPGTDRILMGDFNFPHDQNYSGPDLPLENDHLARAMPRYVDGWSAVNPATPGYTLDQVVNFWRGSFVIKRRRQFRLDRVMLQLGAFHARRMVMWANEPIAQLPTGPVFPSDHFGVMVELNRAPSPDPSISASASHEAPAKSSAKPPAAKPASMAYLAAMKRLEASASAPGPSASSSPAAKRPKSAAANQEDEIDLTSQED